MAISWGGYESSGGNGMRVGIEVDTSNVNHGDRFCSFSVAYFTQNIHTWSDSQSLNLGGSIGGSIGYQNNQGEGVTGRGARSYIYEYGNDEYGPTGKNRTFSATVNGAYNGITPSKSVTVGIPGRPIAAPIAPSGASLDRINDEANLVTWNNRSNPGEPYDSLIVQRRVNGGAYSTVANLGGGSEKYSDSGAIPNRYWEYRIASKNNAGQSAGWADTDLLWTTPATPTVCVRTDVGTNQRITWNDNVSYPQHGHHIWVSVNGGAFAYLDWVGAVAVYNHDATSPGGAPVPSNKYQYKVRSKTTQGPDLYSSFSNLTTISGGTTTPPDQPSLLAPTDNLVKDPTQPIVLTWQHNPTDTSAQTTWQIQYRVDGGSWSTIDPNPLAPAQKVQSMFTLSPGDFAYGQTIEWQVATAGASGVLSAWSPSATFKTQTLTPVKYPIYLDVTSGRMEALSTGAPSGGSGSAVAAHVHAYRTAGAHTLNASTWESLAFEGTGCVLSESGLAISFTPGGSDPYPGLGAYFAIHETGLYDVAGACTFPANATGKRVIGIWINGAIHSQIDQAPISGQLVTAHIATTTFLEEGDKVWFAVWQNSGVSLALNVSHNYYWGRVAKVDAAPGPAGPPGPAGGAYTHTQGSPVASWVINHPLPYPPSVTVVDSTGRQVEGDVVYTDADTVTVGFSGAFSGVADPIVTELAPASALRDHVPHVVGMGAEEQMIKTAQRRVAVVQDAHAIGYRADLSFVDEAMDWPRLSFGVDHDLAIAIPESGTGPDHAVAIGDEAEEDAIRDVGTIGGSGCDRSFYCDAAPPALVVGVAPPARVVRARAFSAGTCHVSSISEMYLS